MVDNGFELGVSFEKNLATFSSFPPHDVPEIWLHVCKRDARFIHDIGFQGAAIERLLQGAYAAIDYSEIQRQKQMEFLVEILATVFSERGEGITHLQLFKLVAAIGNSIKFHETYHGSETLRRFSYDRGLTDSWGGELPRPP